MKTLLLLPLLLFFGCATAPLEISEKLTHHNPEPLSLETPAPENLTLLWAPEPIEDFIISQNADGFTGRNDYQDFAIGQLISERVESYLSTVTKVVADSERRIGVRIVDARLNYKYAWEELEYVKLTLNVEMSVDGQSGSKVYYRQIINQPEMMSKNKLQAVFDGVSMELGQDILKKLAR